MPADSVPDEITPPGFSTVAFSLCPHKAERESGRESA